MKTLKNILLVTALFGAVSAHANWTITAASPISVPNTGGSGSGTFHYVADSVSPTGGTLTKNPTTRFVVSDDVSLSTWTYVNNGAGGSHYTTTGLNPIFSSFDITSIPASYTQHGAFDIVISWAISDQSLNFPLGNSGTVNFFVKTSADQTQASSFAFNVAAVPVPEPAQTIAGVMLLGCGGLVFVGRRLIKKTSAV